MPSVRLGRNYNYGGVEEPFQWIYNIKDVRIRVRESRVAYIALIIATTNLNVVEGAMGALSLQSRSLHGAESIGFIGDKRGRRF